MVVQNLFIEELYIKVGDREIAHMAIEQNVEDYPYKFFGSFVGEVVEIKDHDTYVDDRTALIWPLDPCTDLSWHHYLRQ